MAHPPEVEGLLRDIDRVIEKYSNSSDRKVRKVIRKLKRSRNKLDAIDAFNIGTKILWLADKIHEYLDQLP